MKRSFLAIVLACIFSCPLAQADNFFTRYYLDIATACVAPAGLIYYLMNKDPEKAQKDAENIVYAWRNNLRAFTTQEINRALEITQMTTKQLTKKLKIDAVVVGSFAGFLCGLFYWACKYAQPTHGCCHCHPGLIAAVTLPHVAAAAIRGL